MQISLAAFPPEILDCILSFSYSQSAVDLWSSGDVLLRQHMSQGLTSMHLLNTKILTLNRFPVMVVQLPKLRSLIINREFNPLLHFQDISSLVKLLPPTLTELSLLFKNASSVFLPERAEPSTSASSSDTCLPKRNDWTLATAFPLLQTLEIANYKSDVFLSALPPQLTSLAIGLPPLIAKQERFFRSLPRQLHCLRLLPLPSSSNMRISNWKYLPPSLLSFRCKECRIDFEDNSSQFMLCLPRSITELEVPAAVRNFTQDVLELLPPRVRSLEVLFQESDAKPVNLGLIMPSLTHVSLVSLPDPDFARLFIRNLPLTVRRITAGIDMTHFEQGDWPASLTELSVNAKNFRPSALPSGLLALDVSYRPSFPTASEISLLPRSLTKLRIANIEPTEETIAFPPHLTYLELRMAHHYKHWIETRRVRQEANATEGSIDGTTVRALSSIKSLFSSLDGAKVVRCFPFIALPRSLTSLQTNVAIPASQLKHLPPHLQILEFEQYFKDLDYSLQDELPSLLASRSTRNDREILDFNGSQDATLSLLLPRSLTRLHNEFYKTQISSLDWLHLPPQLTNLNLGSHLVGISEWRAIMKLPLLFLVVTLERFDDEHCRALSRDFKGLTINTQDVSGLTADGLLHVPINTALFVDALDESTVEEKRYKLAKDFLKNNEFDAFRKLVNAHEHKTYCLNLLSRH